MGRMSCQPSSLEARVVELGEASQSGGNLLELKSGHN